MADNSQTSNKCKQNSVDFNETMKKAQQRANEYLHDVRKQISIQKQKIQRSKQQQQQKAARVFSKTFSKQYTNQQNTDLDIPVDGQLERGSKMFMVYCAPCHSLQQSSQKTTLGPALGLIYNRKIGSDYHYYNYSQNMLKSKKYWTASNLYRFMQNPKRFIEGTTCNIAKTQGLKSQQDRADILQFLKEYSEQLSKNLKIKQVKLKGYSQVQTQIYANQQTKTAFKQTPILNPNQASQTPITLQSGNKNNNTKTNKKN